MLDLNTAILLLSLYKPDMFRQGKRLKEYEIMFLDYLIVSGHISRSVGLIPEKQRIAITNI